MTTTAIIFASVVVVFLLIRLGTRARFMYKEISRDDDMNKYV